jgi:hypothetical protein
LGRKRKVWFRARECCFGHSTHSTGFRGIVSGRGGVAFDRFLVYGTGDVAFGSNTLPNAAVAIVAGIPDFSPTQTAIAHVSGTQSVPAWNTRSFPRP